MTWLIGGEAAARVARTFGLLLSADALLYRLKQAYRLKKTGDEQARNATKLGAAPEALGIEALGIDDFAFRKGQRYGTILIDLATRRPVDLLPDRERSTVEAWLREHPGAKLISRDRSAVYADAIREVAPEAVQVADRFHLLKNLMETLQQQVGKEAAAIRELLLPRSPSQEYFNQEYFDEAPGPVPPSRRQERTRVQSRKKRFENWQRAHTLFGQGYAKKEVARLMDVNVRTVRSYLRAAAFPERQRRSPVNSALTPYKEFILGRWEEGCQNALQFQNALQLWREAKARGYPGSATAVRDFVFPKLRVPAPAAGNDASPEADGAGRSLTAHLILAVGPARAAHLILAVGPARAAHGGAERAGGEVVSGLPDFGAMPGFGALVSGHDASSRGGRTGGLVGSGQRQRAFLFRLVSCFVSFARGLRADRAAVEAAFALEWSNGPTEGNVNRLKLIKRQGYGRASFDLLKARVLPLAA